jgi:hypothetical protein
MSGRQIEVDPESETKRLDRIGRGKWVAMISNILAALEFVFGCWHRNVSRPFTLSGWTYEVCLNCGKQFAYSRAEIGRGVSRQKIVGFRGLAWHENQARSLLTDL